MTFDSEEQREVVKQLLAGNEVHMDHRVDLAVAIANSCIIPPDQFRGEYRELTDAERAWIVQSKRLPPSLADNIARGVGAKNSAVR